MAFNPTQLAKTRVASLWARELKLTAGANRIDAAHTTAVAIDGADAPPAVAIDVAQLGGMYANRIHLVGTEISSRAWRWEMTGKRS